MPQKEAYYKVQACLAEYNTDPQIQHNTMGGIFAVHRTAGIDMQQPPAAQ